MQMRVVLSVFASVFVFAFAFVLAFVFVFVVFDVGQKLMRLSDSVFAVGQKSAAYNCRSKARRVS